MSGGSYDWLYEAQDLEDLQARQFQLEAMAERLAGLGYAQDAARETEELLVLFRQWQTRAGVRVARLADLWQAVEYWDSADRTEDAVRTALAAYRADTAGLPPP
ncbi:hypothetical protein [Streptomyces justiciae]|uniref:Uncharacterized protein n=1 Tax=Streptomyces justiciae TaxID=2780140 RepID=A0ABU3M6R2_9ACTN|nr:hypothetical protein [Streptomyces justiciae]MDT7847206.1 hypothetical protein [Streptomyces justiciae]